MGRRGAPSFGLTLDTPGLDHFTAYSHCIVRVASAMVRTLAMYAVELVNANGLLVQVRGCRRTKLKLNVGASLEPFGSFMAVFTVSTRSFTALLYALTLSTSLLWRFPSFLRPPLLFYEAFFYPVALSLAPPTSSPPRVDICI